VNRKRLAALLCRSVGPSRRPFAAHSVCLSVRLPAQTRQRKHPGATWKYRIQPIQWVLYALYAVFEEAARQCQINWREDGLHVTCDWMIWCWGQKVRGEGHVITIWMSVCVSPVGAYKLLRLSSPSHPPWSPIPACSSPPISCHCPLLVSLLLFHTSFRFPTVLAETGCCQSFYQNIFKCSNVIDEFAHFFTEETQNEHHLFTIQPRSTLNSKTAFTFLYFDSYVRLCQLLISFMISP